GVKRAQRPPRGGRAPPPAPPLRTLRQDRDAGQALEVAKPCHAGRDPLPAECHENADEEGRNEGECRVSHRTWRSRLPRSRGTLGELQLGARGGSADTERTSSCAEQWDLRLSSPSPAQARNRARQTLLRRL